MSPERPLRHKKLYLQGGDVVFLVEGYLCRVHSYFFTRESSYFRSLILHSSSFGDEVKQTTDDNPIVLEDCTADEFATFCWVFYNPHHAVYEATVPQWAAILRLAQFWEFGEIKALAGRELEKLDVEPVLRIHLYHKHQIDSDLLHSAFEALATRATALTEEEGQLLGMKTFARVVHARELARAGDNRGDVAPTPLTVSTGDLRAILARVGLSPLHAHTTGCLDTSVRANDGPQSAPLLAQPAQRPSFGNHRGGSMTVPPTPLETIPETPSTTSSESPPSYTRSMGGKVINGNGKPSVVTWGSGKVKTR